MAQLGFHLDTRYCIACNTCVIACNDKNNLPVEALFRQVHSFEGGKFPKPWVINFSMSCNHCADPLCVKNCPTGALYKRDKDGIVLIDKEKCIGCRYCEWSCPYGAISFLEEENVAGKCDFCVDLIDQGKNPACVDACLMRVLSFGDIEELKEEFGETGDIFALPDPNITQPSILFTPKPEAVKVREKEVTR